MPIQFSKMHGLGNDFMVIERITQSVELGSDNIKAWSNRKTGVGFDQLLIIDPSSKSDCDFAYRIYNSDGTQAEQCGNGARCVALFAKLKNLSAKKNLHWERLNGTMETDIIDGISIKVNMGVPNDFSEHTLTIDDTNFTSYFISMGNPHVVIFLDHLEQVALETLAPTIQHHPHFGAPVNVNFAQFIDRQNIHLIVYERGVGFTQACGSGASATMAVARLQNQVDARVNIEQPGGCLLIEWENTQTQLWMHGPAVHVFDGVL